MANVFISRQDPDYPSVACAQILLKPIAGKISLPLTTSVLRVCFSPCLLSAHFEFYFPLCLFPLCSIFAVYCIKHSNILVWLEFANGQNKCTSLKSKMCTDAVQVHQDERRGWTTPSPPSASYSVARQNCSLCSLLASHGHCSKKDSDRVKCHDLNPSALAGRAGWSRRTAQVRGA